MVARGAGGLWPKGQSGNPGGRPKLPEEFRLKGPKLLERMTAIAEDEAHECHFEALKWCAERIYGKAGPVPDETPPPDPTAGLAALLRERGKLLEADGVDAAEVH